MSYVLSFEEVGPAQTAVVGGKGAHLSELSRIEGIRVPLGFCVTTRAFERIMARAPSHGDLLDQLIRLRPNDREAIGALAASIRRAIEGIAIPDDIAAAIARSLRQLGEQTPCAVRSSATAEDLPTASFAGQHDTYLNVVGPEAILEHVRRCWASLFTERAVAYRLRNGFDHRHVRAAVVVQRMVLPQVSGILFTADPTTGNRKIAAVEACFGLGEALVSGLVNADSYKVRDGTVISRKVAAKRVETVALPSGGTRTRPIEPERQEQPALTDVQVVRIVELGRRIEARFGCPQDIEWCLVDDDFHIVQSRPITTLFPIPPANDGANHVYISVGHQQMMTDPIKPLGLSFWQMTTPRPMAEAGGRLFVDVTRILASPATRTGLLDMAERSDPLIHDALQTILDRGDFVPKAPDDDKPAWVPPSAGPAPIEPDPSIVAGLIARSQASVAALARDIRTRSGTALLDFILADLSELKRLLFDPESHRVVMAAIEATWWLNERMAEWLGEKNAADTLSQSVPHNVTSEMGLALMDVADVIRPHSEVVAFLERTDDQGFLDDLPKLAGGSQAQSAIQAFLDKYGMRGAGEIDITRPRFCERPTALVPLLLGHIKTSEPGARERRFEQGREEARKKEQQLLLRLRALPDGEPKAEETKRMIARLRTFIGYREYPKYGMICRYLVYKRALLEEAGRLVQAGVLREKEDIYYLRFDELQEVARTQRIDEQLLRERKEAFRSYQTLTPPRVITSDGEALTGAYRRSGVPAGALVGLPVSAGIVEGRARVIFDIAQSHLEAGDILVTTFTDPSFAPLFVAIKGLVTEVGGRMTHGAVIAREYGLPAIVGVENATRLIRDGQRIRLDGTEGIIELLD